MATEAERGNHHPPPPEAIEAVTGGETARDGRVKSNVVVVHHETTMGSAVSSSSLPPPLPAPASDLGALLHEPGGGDEGEEVVAPGEKNGGRRASSTSSSTSFLSAAGSDPGGEEASSEAHLNRRAHSSRILFDGALVDESKILVVDEDKSPELVLSDEETAASVASGGSTVASLVAASIEECVEHGEDGTKCAYPGSNGRCRHSLYGAPLPAEEVVERMGPEWAAAVAGRVDGRSDDEGGGGGGDGDGDGGGGLIWHVRIVPDDFDEGGKVRHLSARDYDAENGRIKARRGPKLPVTASDFFSSLVRIEGGGGGGADASATAAAANGGNRVSAEREGGEKSRHEERLWGMWDGKDDGVTGGGGSEHGSDSIFRDDDGTNRLDVLPTVDDIPLIGPHLSLYLQARPDRSARPCRYVFSGVLDGWPALSTLELLSVQCRGKIPRWSTRWSHDSHGRAGLAPTFPEGGGAAQEVRATLRAPPWSAHGWSRTSPGFVFWYEPEECRRALLGVPGGAASRLRYGTDIAAQVEEDRVVAGLPAPKCVRAHMVSHRYARGSAKRESSRDRLTYHSVVLLEWDHGRHCTVVEGAFLNGVGGYAGRSNWCYDEEPEADATTTTTTGLYRALPPEMVMPWKERLSEIRCIDVPARSLDEFKDFVRRHEGHGRRFVDPRYSFSHDVRLTFRSKDHVATYLLNYIRRDRTYSEIRRNCQTFAADFCGFLAGKKDVQPFHPVNQVRYTCRKHYFLYESDMYG